MVDDIGAEADGCDLGDQRLNARYRLWLTRLGEQPQRSIPAACRGTAEVEPATVGTSVARPKKQALAEKESYRWLDGYRTCGCSRR